MNPPDEASAAWAALAAHRDNLAGTHLRELVGDADRIGLLTLEVADLRLDLSRQPLTATTVDLLVDLATEREVGRFVERMLSGEPVNSTEGRPALHTALRAPRDTTIEVDGADVVAAVHENLERMAHLARRIRSGEMVGATGTPIDSVVALGVGGSHLGPAMVSEALADLAHPEVELRFSSNFDGTDLVDALRGLDPVSTLVVVSSKSFTTAETLVAAAGARAWLADGVGSNGVGRHLVAVTGAPDRAGQWGVDPEMIFPVPQWVGGRFSLASAIGLALMVSIGPESFGELLGGMRAVDEHLAGTPFAANGPVMLGLLDVWHRSFLGAGSLAVVPYSSRLARFPSFLQQLMMESLGKRVTAEGSPVGVPTGGVVWGAPGTDGQHAFFQYLHQGTGSVPCDLIGFMRPGHDPGGTHHDMLVANLLAQAEALAVGRTPEEAEAEGTPPELVPHRTMPGNRPSTLILAPELSPSVLGQLIALYEHRTVVAAALWGINPFDQWGVELGKTLARHFGRWLEAEPAGDGTPDPGAHEGSTSDLIGYYRRLWDRGDG